MQLSDFFDDARREVKGASDAMLLDSLQRACTEFFHQSGGWRERIDPSALAVGVYEYDIDVPSGTQLARVENVMLSSSTCGLTPIKESEFFALDLTKTAPRPDRYAVAESTNTLLLWPVPDGTVADSFKILVCVTGDREVITIPDAIGHRWRDGIVAGAVGRLLQTNNRPWTNHELGQKREAIFWEYVARAKRESVSGQYVKPMRVQLRKFV
jgi:hypothetical protein